MIVLVRLVALGVRGVVRGEVLERGLHRITADLKVKSGLVSYSHEFCVGLCSKFNTDICWLACLEDSTVMNKFWSIANISST